MSPRPSSLPTRARGVLAAAAVLALATTACRDEPAPDADSSLARDLALANVVAQPQFNDVPLGQAPEPEQLQPEAPPAPVTRPVAERPDPPAPRRAPAPAPARRREQAPEPAPERVEEPAPAPAPVPAREAVGFAAGTRLALATDARVCTVSGRPGDKLTATLREPVRGTGGATIPAGTTIVLEVASVSPGDPAESGTIAFRVRSLDVNEAAHPASGRGTVSGGLDRAQVARVNASDRKKVIGGAVLGAIVGRVVEGSARGAVIGAAAGGTAGAVSARGDRQYEGCLPAGSAVTITLDEALTVS